MFAEGVMLPVTLVAINTPVAGVAPWTRRLIGVAVARSSGVVVLVVIDQMVALVAGLVLAGGVCCLVVFVTPGRA